MSKTNVVLVVEDDPHSAQLLSMMLARKGYEALVVTDGEAALEALGEVEPVLILLDMLLPTLDGWGFLQRYYSNASEPRPIIAVSAGRIAEDTLKGVTAYLPKPFGMTELNDAISYALSQTENFYAN